ncbi:MAG: transglycosylase SLT domain-containing protein [Acidobacteriales bacterium]|nr:transglycosylase SLT domain-containing protein [Terriglobales bacterium]
MPAETAIPQSASQPESAEAVSRLIANVEEAYRSGQQNYKAGHLDAAKQDFDRAFNTLLESSLDVRADERLQQELERLLDGVNGLEIQALQQGDGFTEQKPEPAPIDEANEITFPADPNVRAKAAEEVKATKSDLPLMLTDPVVSYISYFSSARGKGTLESALIRGGRYREMIESTLKEEGVPQDLIYLAQAESGFRPLALSKAGARGMWQFVPGRAASYGLQRNWWLDERQDPEKSTRAAAKHLKDLYAQFGDWYLAMAAYNSGPGTVQSAVKRTGYADFWELYRRDVLPAETRNYVPIIIAVTIMAKNPAQYGLEDLPVQKPVPYETVRIDYPVDLRLVAECVDASATELQELNPSLLRLTTPKDEAFDLHLPAGSKERYLSAVSGIPPDMRVWWHFHKVTPGETLTTLAGKFHTTADAIAKANNLEPESDLATDSNLIIPVAPGKKLLEHADYARHATAYKVRRGDTVETVAEAFSVPPDMVRRWNHLKGSSLRGRRVVYVHLPEVREAQVSPESEGKTKRKKQLSATANSAKPVPDESVIRHKVQRGETLSSIAETHHTTVAALERTNGKVPVLRPGMILLVRSVP